MVEVPAKVTGPVPSGPLMVWPLTLVAISLLVNLDLGRRCGRTADVGAARIGVVRVLEYEGIAAWFMYRSSRCRLMTPANKVSVSC